MVGRTLALYQTAAFGGIALGSWTWGLLAERLSISEALVLSALVHLLAVLVGLRWALPNDEETNLEPLNRWKEPSIGMEIQHPKLDRFVDQVVDPRYEQQLEQQEREQHSN